MKRVGRHNLASSTLFRPSPLPRQRALRWVPQSIGVEALWNILHPWRNSWTSVERRSQAFCRESGEFSSSRSLQPVPLRPGDFHQRRVKIFGRKPKKRESFLVQRNVCPLQSLIPSVLLITRKRLKLACSNPPRSRSIMIGGEAWALHGTVTLDLEGRLSASRLPFFSCFFSFSFSGERFWGLCPTWSVGVTQPWFLTYWNKKNPQHKHWLFKHQHKNDLLENH